MAGACAGSTTVTRTFTATDACGNTATASQVVTVLDRTAPVLANIPAAATIECGAAEPTALPTATDACDSNPAITVARTEMAGACAGSMTVTRLFTATDACGNTATASQVVTVLDGVAPVLANVPRAVTIECGAAEPMALPTATDACDSNPTITVVRTEVAGACAGSTTVTRTFTATDACGNTATASQVVTVVDTEAPTFVGVPADVSLTCGQALPTAMPTVTDACDAAPTVTVVEVRTPGATANDYTVTRLFTATDACGNEAFAQQVVTYGDSGVPAFTNVPAAVTLACGEGLPTELATAEDGCDGALAVAVTEATVAGACAGASTVTRTFTAVDADGNRITATQVVTYEDRTAPVLANIPAAATIECGAAEPTALPTATDACDSNPTMTVVRTEVAGACVGSMTVTRTFTATDACGNTATASQVVTVLDRTAPVLANIPAAATIECGAAEPTAVPTGTDACDSNPTITVVRTEVAGSCAGSTTVTRTFTATDACGNTATASQVVTVLDGVAPVLANVPRAVTIECGAAEPTALPTATDACDSNPTITVVRTEVAGACAGSMTVRRLFTATDACGNTATASQVVTVVDSEAPTFVGVPADVSLTCGQALPTAMPTVTDACDAAPTVTVVEVRTPGATANDYTVTRLFTATDACGNEAFAQQVVTYGDSGVPAFTNVPAAMTLACGEGLPTELATAEDGCDGALAVAVTEATVAGACAGASTVTRTFTAVDADGNRITATQVVTYEDRTAPVLANIPAAATIECGAAEPTALPTATDACDSNPTMTVVRTEVAGACVGSMTVTRTFTATDACGNTATASQVVTVLDRTAPVLANIPAAVTIECGAAEPTALPTATDACDSNPTITVARTEVAGACAGSTTVTRTFTATDACGNTATASQVVTVLDGVAPVLANVPRAVTIECGAAEPTALPTATDACDSNPTITVVRTEVAGVCAGSMTVTRTFTATDACGNTATASQVVTVVDTEAPTFVGVPADVSLTCGQALPTAMPTVTDACDAAPTVTVVEVRTSGPTANDYTVTRLFTATDACGNEAFAQQVVTYGDSGVPAFTNVPAAMTLACGEGLPTELATAEDGCDGALAVAVTEATVAGACAGASTVTRTFTAVDADGNRITATQVVTFEDRTAPVLANIPAAATIECGAAEPTALPTATDACDSNPTITVVRSEVAGACAGSTTVTRTFTATDACGNTATASQVVTVLDRTAPVLANIPAAATIECGAAEPTATADGNGRLR